MTELSARGLSSPRSSGSEGRQKLARSGTARILRIGVPEELGRGSWERRARLSQIRAPIHRCRTCRLKPSDPIGAFCGAHRPERNTKPNCRRVPI
eukprot:15001339-Alexandrium_andersonii.AAC.1